MSRNEAILTSAAPQASAILASLGQAAFVWEVATDAIAWSAHASSVFPRIPASSAPRAVGSSGGPVGLCLGRLPAHGGGSLGLARPAAEPPRVDGATVERRGG